MLNIIIKAVTSAAGLFVPQVIELAKKETPKVGEKLAARGAKLLATGGTLIGASATIQLPDVPETWMVLIQNLTTLIGTIVSLVGAIQILVGKTQTTDNPDTDRNIS